MHSVHHRSQGGTVRCHFIVFCVAKVILTCNRTLKGAASMYMAPLDFIIEIVAPYAAFVILIRTDLRFDLLLASIGTVFGEWECLL
jgi:hypothetical protein